MLDYQAFDHRILLCQSVEIKYNSFKGLLNILKRSYLFYSRRKTGIQIVAQLILHVTRCENRLCQLRLQLETTTDRVIFHREYPPTILAKYSVRNISFAGANIP